MKSKLAPIWIFIIMSFFSCEQVIPYPYLAKEDALIEVWCELSDADSAIVNISKLFAITHEHRDKNDYLDALDSDLQFFVNGKEVPAQLLTSSQQDKYKVVYPFQQGDKISLICSAPEMPTVTASTQIPYAAPTLIHDFRLTKEQGTLSGYLVLKDNPDTYDAYEVNIDLVEHYTQFKGDEIVKTGQIRHGAYTANPGVFQWAQLFDDTYADKHSEIKIDFQDLSLFYKPGVVMIDGEEIMMKTWVEARAMVSVLSKELYYYRLRTQSHSMSPSSYTNIIGGFGYLGAKADVTSETLKYE